ncbi:MAG: hypothetical protein ACYCTH_04660 [Cellulomonas sp.]
MRERLVAVIAIGAALGLMAGCTGVGSHARMPERSPTGSTAAGSDSTGAVAAEPGRRGSVGAVARTAASTGTTVAAETSPAALALRVSREWWAQAPVVVVAAADDAEAVLRASSVAVMVGAPVLLAGPDGTGGQGDALRSELSRLGAVQVLTAGAVDGALLVNGDVHPAVLALPDALPALAGVVGAARLTARPTAPADAVASVLALVRGASTVLVTTASTAGASGAEPAPAASAHPPNPIGGVRHASESLVPRRAVLGFRQASAPAGAVLLASGDAAQLAAIASARAAGVSVLVVPGGDPRTTPGVIDALARSAPSSVLALGADFGTDGVLAGRVATAATGVQLPGGGQTIEPGKRYVALYGTPGSPSLGLLGEQDVPATIARADAMAAPYRALTPDVVIPTVEIIATVASGGPGADGNYSNERPVASLRPLVDAARAAGDYVVLDLQPGRTDFLTQARQYTELLALPDVGLALDPEWRLGPDQVHLRQIGSVSVDEVNGVAAWLADLTRARALPQKLFVVHEFSVGMVPGIDRLDTSHDELAVLIHVDGQGAQPDKAGTWATLRASAPQVRWWGWKNFVDEDHPMLDPTQTYQVQPTPDLVTYQ